MEVDSCQIKQSTVKIATLNLFSPKVNRLFTRKRGLTMNLKDVHPVGKQESNKKITIEITVSTRNGNKRRGYPLLFFYSFTFCIPSSFNTIRPSFNNLPTAFLKAFLLIFNSCFMLSGEL